MWLFLAAILMAIWIWPQFWERLVKPKIRLSVEILDPIVDKGAPVNVRCTIINESYLPCPRVHCSIRLPQQLESNLPDRVEFVEFSTYVWARQKTDVTFTLKSVKRGYGKIVQGDFMFIDGFGLRKFYHTIPLSVGVVVRPTPVAPTQTPIRLLDLLGDVRTQRFYNEDPSLLLGIRPYQAGDPFKYISWLTTARSQQLMVKQFGYTTTARCLIILSGQFDNPFWLGVNETLFDLLCTRVLQMTEQLLQAGIAVGLYTNMYDNMSHTHFEPPASANWQLEKIRTRMGAIEFPSFSLADALQHIPHYTSNGDLVILVTGYWDDAVAARCAQLQQSRRSLHVYLLNDAHIHPHQISQFPIYVESPSQVSYESVSVR